MRLVGPHPKSFVLSIFGDWPKYVKPNDMQGYAPTLLMRANVNFSGILQGSSVGNLKWAVMGVITPWK